jgi:hypothetical protein
MEFLDNHYQSLARCRNYGVIVRIYPKSNEYLSFVTRIAFMHQVNQPPLVT